jgi:membrane carboxypeptidase/penicillin-binding protein PbpC
MRNVSGLDGAGPIWHGVMQAAMADLTPTWLTPPEGLVRATVCAPTGALPGPDCPASTEEWFVAGTQPQSVETYYARDAAGGLVYDLPAEARAWALTAGLALADPGFSGEAPFIVQPASGSVLFVAGELVSQAVVLRASPPAGTQSIEFVVDGALAGSAHPANPTIVWNLTPGAHVLEVRALLAGGQIVTVQSTFEVRG